MELGVLLLRAVGGLTLAAHGAQKVFGWFGGGGLDGTAAFFESLGLRGGRRTAGLVGAAELVGGLALAVGFATPVAAGLIVAVMAGAALTAHRGKGFFVTDGGWELPVVLAAVAIGVTMTGPGAWSVDAALGTAVGGATAGIVAALAGVVAAGVAAAVLDTQRGWAVRVRPGRAQTS